MSLKIQGGTRSGKSLCHSCTHAHIRKGASIGQEMVFCQNFYDNPHLITYPIVECNDYKDANLPSLRAMQEIAWFITTDKRTGKIGFLHGDKVDEKLHEEVKAPDFL